MALPMTTTHHASPTGRTTRNHPFAPDVLLPEQFHGPESAAAKSSGERSLMLAVLEDGIRCFQEFSRDHRVGPQMLGRQAQRWIESTSADWPLAPLSCHAVMGVALTRASPAGKEDCAASEQVSAANVPRTSRVAARRRARTGKERARSGNMAG